MRWRRPADGPCPSAGDDEEAALTDEGAGLLWGDLSPLVDAGRLYDNAPIVEAILDLQVVLPSSDGLSDVSSLSHVMDGDGRFTAMAPVVEVQGDVQVTEQDVVGTASGRHMGYTFPRADGARVVHARLDRFAFSWMAPYERWESFLREAEAMWHRYAARAEPQAVTGVGVRFINRIDVPSSPVEIRDYLRTAVDVSPYLPQGVSSMFMQVDIPLEQYDAVVTITSALSPPARLGFTSLILDIDAKRQVSLDRAAPDFETSLVEVMAALRAAKNFVFEACITDGTRGLIR